MLTSEQRYFLQILRNFINKQSSIVPKDVMITPLLDYGKKHEVLGILYYQTKLPELMKSYFSTLYLNTNRLDMIQTLTSQFTFPFCIVKGSEIAEIYPVPLLRTMGDIDLVVQPGDKVSAHQILISLKYANVSMQAGREWQYYKNGLEFELHDHLIYNETINDLKQESFFNDFWPYVKNNHLDWNFHFLFLVSHLRKHFMNEGVGFRQFMDIAIVAKYIKLDWSWIKEKAEEINLYQFLLVVLSFCNRWFGTSVPYDIPKLTDEFYETSTTKIFRDGVFGISNVKNSSSTAVNLHRKEGYRGMLKVTLKHAFPSYQVLRNVPEFHFIDGKPLLLPIAWVYRMLVRSKSKDAIKIELSKSFTSTNEIKKRQKLYDQWGL